MLFKSAISVYILYNCLILAAYVFLADILLLTPCDVIGLLCNNKDVVAYTTLLTAQLQVCFCMNMLKTNYATYDYDLYTQLAGLWVWLISIIIMILLVFVIYIHMYILDINGGNTKLLSLHLCLYVYLK